MADDKKRTKLTVYDERLARAAVSNPHATLVEIGKQAGHLGSDTVVRASTWRSLQKPAVQARIRELLDSDKATSLDGLHQTLKQGLDAKDTKFFAHEGEVIDQRTTIDYVTRHKYLETALELHGAMDKQASGVTNNYFTKEAIEAFVIAFKRKQEDKCLENSKPG